MIVDSDRTFPRESPVCAYWLTRCEGFTVRSESRVLGVVESVAGDGRLGLAETLLVRSRYRQRLLYTEEVTAVVPARQLLITACSLSFASTRGSLSPPTSWPSMLSAALIWIGPVTTPSSS